MGTRTEHVFEFLCLHPNLFGSHTLCITDSARGQQEGVRQAQRQVVDLFLHDLEIVELVDLEYADVLDVSFYKFTRLSLLQCFEVGRAVRTIKEDHLGSGGREGSQVFRQVFQ